VFTEILFKFAKPFLTPERILPIVYEWLAGEWQKSKTHVAEFIYRGLANTKLKTTATIGEVTALIMATEQLLSAMHNTPEWDNVVSKFDALLTAEALDDLIGPRLSKK
jgi:hypothetical protein